MWKIGILCLVLLVAGCATSPGTGLISPMPEELKKINKDIASAWREWKAPYVRTQDNRRYNKPDAEYIPINEKQQKEKNLSVNDAIDQTADTIVTELRDYCASHGGTATLAICFSQNAFIQCVDDQKNRLVWPIWLRGDSGDSAYPSRYFICRKGGETLLEVGVGQGMWHPLGQGMLSGLFVRTDSPQQRAKDRALGPNEMDEYHLLKSPTLERRRLYDLIARFEKKDDPENLLPRARERLNQLTQVEIAADKAATIAKTAATEKVAQLKRQDFLAAVNTGSLVCRTAQASVDMPTGVTVMGQPQTVAVQGKAQIAGYVNQRANQKLQIQVSAIHFRWIDDSYRSHEQELDSLNHFQGSAALRINGVIWDSENDWEFCNK